ncbi:TPA: glycosyltransferase [Streptococcus suis]|uniref:Glycosyltransferase n=1 Tax=Streptococcus suis TaxID=1307 RepID=A0A1C9IG02_STRSU|nr:Glycosyltransferase [Streptococcus suis]AOP03442.1 Glycosyltransferase [Streptococcus suis]APZ79008.1 Glycosyltransferase [Streptococcus suis]HEM2814579.1 glycosyltransferase [Streptococcus suis]
MKIQVMIATMGKDNLDFLEEMNLETDTVVANQYNEDFVEEYLDSKGNVIKHIMTKTKGLSVNRNICLAALDSDIAIISDDDVEFLTGSIEKVHRAFIEHPNADVIIFNIYESNNSRYVINKVLNVGYLNYMRFGSVRIAFRTASIKEKLIRFDEEFGSGGNIPLGEDTIFLKECLDKKLKIIAVPDYILKLKDIRESTWFNGYNEKFFINKGKLFYRLNPKFYLITSLFNIIKHYRKYSSYGSFYRIYRLMISGALEYKLSRVN